MAMTPVMLKLEALGGKPSLRMGVKKAGPVVTDQGNLVIDVKFDSIDDPADLERTINNMPGVLENGLFVGVADLILVGEIIDAPEFYYAEVYHQQYLAKNPGGYCGLGGTKVECPIALDL